VNAAHYRSNEPAPLTGTVGSQLALGRLPDGRFRKGYKRPEADPAWATSHGDVLLALLAEPARWAG
jgi:hypothetical protein